MIQSMTGYGKAEAIYNDSKIVAEIRSVNGKGAEISIKTPLFTKEREIDIRRSLSAKLIRGSIDLFVSIESVSGSQNKSLNGELFISYYEKLRELSHSVGGELNISDVMAAILRLPDVIETQRGELDETQQKVVDKVIDEAILSLIEFRTIEGTRLEEDIVLRVNTILSYLDEIEKYEEERTGIVRERITSRLEELSSFPLDSNRLEQELIYYIEKMDITEEKVRLRQHCAYFLDTVKEVTAGKKLGFIAQEMGREINTLGSKANHADIQQWVVRMKDELEKIKEQVLNIL